MATYSTSGPRAGKRTGGTDLAGLHAACEANYARLLRLFPDYEQSNSREFELCGARVRLEVIERSRYTTIFRCFQYHSGSHWLESLKVDLRAYHDAGMVEVGAFQSHRNIQPRYDYPNPAMYQQDEKVQQNLFLADWLEYCLQSGFSTRVPGNA